MASLSAKHIVFMFADDLGWSDISLHGGTQIPTPAIDGLAREGVTLNNYFVQPVCSPSRATLMTGRHVIHTGVYTAFGNDAGGDLSLNFTLLPERLKAAGYQTHGVGKWHFGFSSWQQTPLHRGFDSWLGYLGGAQDYWIHGFKEPNAYLDFVDGQAPAFDHTCWRDDACGDEYYSTHLFARRAIEMIEAAAGSAAPLFLCLAWQSVHSVEGPDSEQLKAPQRYIDTFEATIPDRQRRVFAAMTTTLDEGVANVTAALRRTGMYEHTLLIFSTDNGGPADGYDRNWASNWPLRGGKGSLLDGGVRGIGIVSGGAIAASRHGRVLDGYVHLADLHFTMLSFATKGRHPAAHHHAVAAAAAVEEEPPFQLGDGLDLYEYIVTGDAADSPRSEVLHEAHPPNSTDGIGNALRVGDWKILLRTGAAWPRAGSTGGATPDGWFGGAGSSDPSTDGYILPIGATTQPWTVDCNGALPRNATAGFACELQPPGAGADRIEHACLFHVREDPCETVDRSRREPEVLQRLWLRLQAYRATAVFGPAATRNPDGKNCPEVRTVAGCSGGGAAAPMNCSAKLPCES